MKVVFLIGSPRSGTTILENILYCHENIAEFYEPYYLWENFFCADKSDVWKEGKISESKKRNISKEFSMFAHKSKKIMVLDKSPTHSFNPYHYLNKSRWHGKVGWGPRFAGWENYLDQHSELEFNAMQWVKSVESVIQYWPILPRDKKIEVRYEKLLLEPEKTVCDIQNF